MVMYQKKTSRRRKKYIIKMRIALIMTKITKYRVKKYNIKM